MSIIKGIDPCKILFQVFPLLLLININTLLIYILIVHIEIKWFITWNLTSLPIIVDVQAHDDIIFWLSFWFDEVKNINYTIGKSFIPVLYFTHPFRAANWYHNYFLRLLIVVLWWLCSLLSTLMIRNQMTSFRKSLNEMLVSIQIEKLV